MIVIANMSEMLKGVLEGMVLQIISKEETYGYEIVRQLNRIGFAGIVEGTVYTLLVRLEKNGLVNIKKKPSDLGPPRKFYSLNARGRQALTDFWERWDFISTRIEGLKKNGGYDHEV